TPSLRAVMITTPAACTDSAWRNLVASTAVLEMVSVTFSPALGRGGHLGCDLFRPPLEQVGQVGQLGLHDGEAGRGHRGAELDEHRAEVQLDGEGVPGVA